VSSSSNSEDSTSTRAQRVRDFIFFYREDTKKQGAAKGTVQREKRAEKGVGRREKRGLCRDPTKKNEYTVQTNTLYERLLLSL